MSNEYITINFVDLQNSDAVALNVQSVSTNVLLNPFYATEEDVTSSYMDEPGTYVEQVRRIIFNGSIAIDNILAFVDLAGITPQQLFMIKRDYVICYGVYEFGKILNLDYLSAENKSKFLGDVKISLQYQKDPGFIKATLGDAKDCMESIAALLQSWNSADMMMSIFVKGEDNPHNKLSFREWWNDHPLQPNPIAATKKIDPATRRVGKIGPVQNSYYAQFKEI